MAALLYALAYTALMYLFAYLLYRKKWFFRV
jgi:predicted acyltransferase